ncbi:MAG TPA: glycosyltransferase family 4 protein [Pyrinomonadaceae bacterium]|jgi:glycosyltransferase involved in cell wall biosynthesis
MIKVTALTASKVDPSSRFRIRQFIEPLKNLGINLDEHRPLINRYRIEPLPLLAMALRIPGLLASRFSDVTWLGRELVSGRSTLERFAGKKRVFDVDDAIWLPYKTDFSAQIARQCDGVIAGNRFLAEHYERAGAKVWLVPTSVDTEVWMPADRQAGKPWTIGWIGSRSNLKFLYDIEEPLAQFLNEHSETRLLIVCDRRPSFEKIPDDKWVFQQWSIEIEVGMVQQMDVGLMPLDDSEMSRGKCGFKMLSYMAVGLPVIVTPVGVNQEILGHDEVGFAASAANDWYAALERLFTESDLGRELGEAGRGVVEEHYSVTANAPKLAKIFREVVSG